MSLHCSLTRVALLGGLGCMLGAGLACGEDKNRELPLGATDPDKTPDPTTPVTEKPTTPLGGTETPAAQAPRAGEPTATATLQAATGSSINGEAKLYADGPSGVRIVLEVKNAPSGQKGVHIHEKGDCSDIAGMSMGSHFTPEGNKHSLPSEAKNDVGHLGDLGNMTVGADGNGRLEFKASGANLKQGDAMSFLGKALVVHSGVDHGMAAQPTGDSGKPIACGVIGS